MYFLEGVLADSEELLELAKMLDESQHIQFQGLYSHNGQSYCADSTLAINKITNHVVSELLKAVERCDNYLTFFYLRYQINYLQLIVMSMISMANAWSPPQY